MAADVDIVERNSSNGTITIKTSLTIRMKNADDSAPDSADPMVIPGAGSDFSFTKWLQLRIGATAPSDKINNFNFYTDGVNDFGVGVNLWAKSAAAFSAPSEPITSSGYGTAHALTVGAPMTLSSTDFSGTSSNVGSLAVLLMEVSATATVGALSTETITFSYDEI